PPSPSACTWSACPRSPEKRASAPIGWSPRSPRRSGRRRSPRAPPSAPASKRAPPETLSPARLEARVGALTGRCADGALVPPGQRPVSDWLSATGDWLSAMGDGAARPLGGVDAPGLVLAGEVLEHDVD